MATNYRNMAIWTAVAGSDQDTYWEAIVDPKGVNWEVLKEIGISPEKDREADFVLYLRHRGNLWSQKVSDARELVRQAVDDSMWTGPNCPTKDEIATVARLWSSEE